MNSAPLVKCGQKIPNNVKREKNTIRWNNLEGISGEGNGAEHHGNFWDCHRPRDFLGSLSIPGWAVIRCWREKQVLQSQLCLRLHELELSTLFYWALISLNINWGCVGVELNDLTMSKDSKVLCCLNSETILESHRKLAAKPGPESFLWPQASPQFYLLFTMYRCLRISAVVFLQQVGPLRQFRRTSDLAVLLTAFLHSTPAHIHSLFRLFLSSFRDVKNRVDHFMYSFNQSSIFEIPNNQCGVTSTHFCLNSYVPGIWRLEICPRGDPSINRSHINLLTSATVPTLAPARQTHCIG